METNLAKMLIWITVLGIIAMLAMPFFIERPEQEVSCESYENAVIQYVPAKCVEYFLSTPPTERE